MRAMLLKARAISLVLILLWVVVFMALSLFCTWHSGVHTKGLEGRLWMTYLIFCIPVVGSVFVFAAPLPKELK